MVKVKGANMNEIAAYLEALDKPKMTRQEEIDWGLRGIIKEWTRDDWDVYHFNFSKAILNYLHSQGACLCKQGTGIMWANGEPWYQMEPLIKEPNVNKD